MTTLGENLKAARKSVGLSQDAVAKQLRTKYNLKIDRPMISKWEIGFQVPNIFSVKCLAEIYNTTMDALNAGVNGAPSVIAADTMSPKPKTIGITPVYESSHSQKETTIQLPILGEVAAGIGSYADNNIVGYEQVPASWCCGTENHILLRVNGDSMEPEFKDGDLLLVRVQNSVDSGSIAVALIDGDSGVVKKVNYSPDQIELESFNKNYAPRVFSGVDMERVRIFGLVKKSIRNF